MRISALRFQPWLEASPFPPTTFVPAPLFPVHLTLSCLPPSRPLPCWLTLHCWCCML